MLATVMEPALTECSDDRSPEKLGEFLRQRNGDYRIGRLVVIGATSIETGEPLPQDQLPYRMPMYVDWVPDGEVATLLRTLQVGNPQRLAIYATMRTTIGDVQRMKASLEPERIRGEWFNVWKALLDLLKIVGA
jgi:hypothetical protein